MPAAPVVARAMLHQWEEPCLVGDHGAGCVFFSGCNLRCCFCQNGTISREGFGKPISVERLRDIFRELIAQGAACLDLVTPTHFTPAILEALGDEEWPVPVVWNCGGYESVETLRPVSYTHLDVYKRQPFHQSKSSEAVSSSRKKPLWAKNVTRISRTSPPFRRR